MADAKVEPSRQIGGLQSDEVLACQADRHVCHTRRRDFIGLVMLRHKRFIHGPCKIVSNPSMCSMQQEW
ncbi:MAG: hypothetical protein JWQ23_2489 [Herminiimonas sp.]|jgi:hypothetical protein|nr:hypothetical protein [Herminiimonas sp.]